MSCLAKKETHYDRCRTARNPENRALLKMLVQICRRPKVSSHMACEDRTQESCQCENEEIDAASRATLHVIGIHFLDDAVGNHGGARPNPEDEHSYLRGKRERLERDLERRPGS